MNSPDFNWSRLEVTKFHRKLGAEHFDHFLKTYDFDETCSLFTLIHRHCCDVRWKFRIELVLSQLDYGSTFEGHFGDFSYDFDETRY